MREIFDQDRAMTLGAVKQATGVLADMYLGIVISLAICAFFVGAVYSPLRHR